MGLISRWAPNSITCCAVPGNTGWYIVATDGSCYTSMANLIAAGDKPFGTFYENSGGSVLQRDAGLWYQSVNISGDNGSIGGATSGAQIAFNQTEIPSSNANPPPQGVLNLPASSNISSSIGGFSNVWINLENAGDRLYFVCEF